MVQARSDAGDGEWVQRRELHAGVVAHREHVGNAKCVGNAVCVGDADEGAEHVEVGGSGDDDDKEVGGAGSVAYDRTGSELSATAASVLLSGLGDAQQRNVADVVDIEVAEMTLVWNKPGKRISLFYYQTKNQAVMMNLTMSGEDGLDTLLV
ncbi:hypothetical protein chiPu_0000223 [Chiloscyllium punctatum]|uniref:Uncharacterized protein n=1 Tax=Chiloscyllium punctatum TaxID=137246 RepID=A0A401RUL1_CHIPU|nr:hypothetical protein [Chiloscyllium punctatum]